MEELLNKIVTGLEKFTEWTRSALNKLIERKKKNAEIRREAEIEILVRKLHALDAVWRVNTDDLLYAQKLLRNEGQDCIWEVDYKHKYLYGRDE